MQRPFARFLSIVVTGLAISSCQGASRATATPSAASPEPTIAATARPAPSATPSGPTESGSCFAPAELSPFAFTVDGSGMLLRTQMGMQIFDLENGQERQSLAAPDLVFTAAQSPDGEIVAWSLANNSVQLVQVSDQQRTLTLNAHTDAVLHLKFSPTGDRLYSASHDGLVRIWNTQDGTLLPSIDAGREVVGIGVSPDGTQLATIPSDGPVQLWDLSNNSLSTDLGGTGGYDTSEAVFSPDGQYLAADLATGLYLWRLSDGALIWNQVQNSMAVAYSPDGQYLAYADLDANNSVVLASPDGAETIRTVDLTQGPVFDLFFSPDGALLAANDGIEIRIWRVSDGQLAYVGKPACP